MRAVQNAHCGLGERANPLMYYPNGALSLVALIVGAAGCSGKVASTEADRGSAGCGTCEAAIGSGGSRPSDRIGSGGTSAIGSGGNSDERTAGTAGCTSCAGASAQSSSAGGRADSAGGSTQTGTSGSTQTGTSGSTQVGTSGSTQAGTSGSTQAGTSGSTQAGTNGSAQAGTSGSAQGGASGSTQAGTNAVAQAGASAGSAGESGQPIDARLGRVTQVAASEGNSCAVLENGDIACWGANSYGQLGQGNKVDIGDDPNEVESLVPIHPRAGVGAAQVAVGNGSACAALRDGSVFCWGRNEYGQLGLGHKNTLGDQPGEIDGLEPVPLGAPATALSITSTYSCALLQGGHAKCWGANGADNNQLGRGQNQPIGDEPGEIAALDPIDFPGGALATALSAGPFHACAALDNGRIACWGMIPRSSASGWLTPRPVSIDVGGRAIDVAAGYNHTVVLLDDGRVKSWGAGAASVGALTDIAGLAAVDFGGDAKALAIDAGDAFTCAILDNNALKCWGENGSGQLGQSTTTSLLNNPSTLGPINLGSGLSATAFATGWSHVCALVGTGRVKCWGTNWAGGLGLGDDRNRGKLVDDMGDRLPFVPLRANP